MTDIEPYENTLSIEQLRRELRYCLDNEFALKDALETAPPMAPVIVLQLLSKSGKWPEDYNRGKKLQRELGLEAIPPKTEYEIGAGVWDRIRKGLLSSC